MTDDSWSVLGVCVIVVLVLGAAYGAWRLFPAHAAAPSLPTHAATSSSTPPNRVATTLAAPPLAPSSGVGQPLSWQDLTLMLRTGLSDEEIIAASAGKALTRAVGPDQETVLRELGAGERLMRFLRTRPLCTIAPVVVPVVVSAPAPSRATAPPGPGFIPGRAVGNVAANAPMPTPIDYVARDRRIKELQMQTDVIDEQINQIRNHPDSYPELGTYNGAGYRVGEESPLKKYLDRLDRQRNDLRREKWKLEGR